MDRTITLMTHVDRDGARWFTAYIETAEGELVRSDLWIGRTPGDALRGPTLWLDNEADERYPDPLRSGPIGNTDDDKRGRLV